VVLCQGKVIAFSAKGGFLRRLLGPGNSTACEKHLSFSEDVVKKIKKSEDRSQNSAYKTPLLFETVS
jgi:hypothetical protein